MKKAKYRKSLKSNDKKYKWPNKVKYASSQNAKNSKAQSQNWKKSENV